MTTQMAPARLANICWRIVGDKLASTRTSTERGIYTAGLYVISGDRGQWTALRDGIPIKVGSLAACLDACEDHER